MNLTLIFGDTESKPEKGVAVVEKMITKDKVDAIIGFFHSSVVLAAEDVTHKYGVPLLVVSATSPKILEKGYEDVFRIVVNATSFSEGWARFAKEYMLPKGLTRYAIIAENTDWGRDMARLVPEKLKGTNAELVSIDIVEVGTMDFYSTLTKYKTLGTDYVYAAITGASSYALITQADELNVPGAFVFAIPDWQFPEAKKIVGDAMNLRVLDLVMYVPGAPLSPKSIPFTEAYKTRYREDPSYVAAEQYDAIYFYVEAVKKAGTTDPEAVVKALHEMEFTGVRGTGLRFSKIGQLTPVIFMAQWQDGKPVVLWPEEHATGKYIPP